MSQGKKSVVLLVEADTTLRRLITLGLQHREMRVIEVDPSADIALHAAQDDVDLLIFDVDNEIWSDWSMLQENVRTLTPFVNLPTILLAWDNMPPQTSSSITTTTRSVSPDVMCMQKPFDARILHTHIDQLLTSQKEREALALAKVEAALLATPVRPAPTIWPIVAAIGLLIAFIGMMFGSMFTLTVTATGIIILVVALLLWTLGAQTPTQTGRLPVPA